MRLFSHHYLWSMTLSLILTAIIFTNAVQANPPSLPVDEPPNSPLIITAYSNNGQADSNTSQLLATQPAYIEIYNNSSSLVAMDGWTLKVISSQAEVDVQLSGQGHMIPKGYAVVSFNQSVPQANFEVTWSDLGPGFYITGYKLIKSGFLNYEVELDKPEEVVEVKQRLRTTSTGYTTTGNYVDDQRPSLFQNDLYMPPASFGLAPVEVLPNAKRCGPTATDLSCGDYVKFYNHTNQLVDFSNLRLRIGYKGQNATINNAIELSGVLEPGRYLIINSRNDGQELSLTNTGGYVWLEDKYGLKTYENTVIQYPSASSTSRVGASWAYDESLSKWDWGVPNPLGANKFASPSQEPDEQGSSLKPCKPNQYRSSETNRCRLIKTASSQLKPCRPDQTRNPETNRCRSNTTASTRKPCRSDQFRNPETGRCKLLAANSSQLKPCRPDQYRNPETNRCRKKPSQAAAVQGFAIEETPPTKQNYLSWWIAITIGLAAMARIAWEWRAEIFQGLSKLWIFKS